MKWQVKWFSVTRSSVQDINRELAKFQPPKYQIIDIKFVNNAQFTQQNEMLILYKEYEVEDLRLKTGLLSKDVNHVDN